MVVSFRRNNLIKQFLNDEQYSMEEVQEQFVKIADLFSESNMVNSVHPFIDCVYLFNSKGKCSSSQFYPQIVENQDIQKQIYREMYSSFIYKEKEYHYVNAKDRSYVCTRIYDDDMQEVGTCIFSIEKEAIRELVHRAEVYEDQIYLVVGMDGETVFSENHGEKLKEKLELSSIHGIQEVRVDGRRYLIHGENNGFGMKSYLLVNKQFINQSGIAMLRPFTLIFLVVIGITAVIVFLVSIGMTKPLKLMGEDIKKFSDEKQNGKMREFDIQEFDEISQLYNEMTQQIESLVSKVYEEQLLATQAQVKYLQSQINPHFLFNILSMLSMRAGLKGDKELQKLLNAFAKLIQGKIFRKGEIKIPLSQEMELVEFYLLLQSERFAGKITYDIFCDSEMKKEKIPRLLVEPLVENGVAHGLEPKQDKGFIQVEVKEEQGKLWIQVRDNGVGFDVADLENKEQIMEDEKHTHIGLVNTRQMLAAVYGEQAVMEIQSKKNQGTCVTIQIPLEGGESHVGCVMIADDEPYIREGLEKLIEWETIGCRLVYSASNGKKLLEEIKKCPPDVVITDIKMPVMGGMEVAEYIYRNNLDISVIFLTAYADFEYAQNAIHCGVSDYIIKTSALEDIPISISRIRKKKEQEALRLYRMIFMTPIGQKEQLRKFFRHAFYNFEIKILTLDAPDEGVILTEKNGNHEEEILLGCEKIKAFCKNFLGEEPNIFCSYSYRNQEETLSVYDKLKGYLENTYPEKGEIHIFQEEKELLKDVENDTLLYRIQNYIENHYMDKITLADIAGAVHVSSGYLSRFYKNSQGENLFDTINTLRISQAKMLLEQGDKKIYEVAELTGFEDTAYFSKVFKKYAGCPPKEYEQMYGKKQNEKR